MSKKIFTNLWKYCIIYRHYAIHGDGGEVVNTSDCGSDTRGFDPLSSPHFKRYKAHALFFVSWLSFLREFFFILINSFLLFISTHVNFLNFYVLFFNFSFPFDNNKYEGRLKIMLFPISVIISPILIWLMTYYK